MAALASCSQMPLEQDGLDIEKTSTKILKLSDSYSPNTFTVKFESVPTDEQLSELCSEGVAGITRVFPEGNGDAELEKQFGLDRWYEVTLSEGASLDGNVSRLAALPEVKVVEYDAIYEKLYDGTSYPMEETKADSGLGFNDPYLSYQWGLSNTGGALLANNAVKGADINVKDVWGTLETYGDPEIIVAVVDEGVWHDHPDLAANMWKNEGEIPGNGIDDDGNGYVDDVYGYNFVDKGAISWGKDGDSGHGTHCAGVIAAVNNNGIGIAGVAGGSGKNDGCRIMSCQIFSGNGGGTNSACSKAIKYAADMGASVISCSYGTSTQIGSDNVYYRSSAIEIDAIHYFEAKKGNNPVIDGNIAVFAAGNETHDYAHYPGAFVDIISVSAIGPDLLPAYYTNYGPGCNIAAPGGEMGRVDSFRSMILSTVTTEAEQKGVGDDNPVSNGHQYGYMQGTSMACPHVSGVVALALSYAKKLGKSFTKDEFKQMILASTQDIDQKISKVESKSYVKIPIKYNGSSGYQYSAHGDLKLAPYYHQMGTGLIDAWQMMMKIEGIPSITAAIGQTDYLDLSDFLGTSSVSLSYLGVEVPESTINSLGLEEIQATNTSKYPAYPEKGYAYVQFGRLYLHPTKAGSGKIIVRAIGGGDHVGGGDNPPGGMEVTTEVSVIAREVASTNGGWL